MNCFAYTYRITALDGVHRHTRLHHNTTCRYHYTTRTTVLPLILFVTLLRVVTVVRNSTLTGDLNILRCRFPQTVSSVHLLLFVTAFTVPGCSHSSY